jgi:hypothetical protein
MSDAPPRLARRIAFGAVAGLATLLTLFLTIGTVSSLVGPDQSAGDRLALLAHVPWLGLGWCAAFAALIWGGARRAGAVQHTRGEMGGV